MGLRSSIIYNSDGVSISLEGLNLDEPSSRAMKSLITFILITHFAWATHTSGTCHAQGPPHPLIQMRSLPR